MVINQSERPASSLPLNFVFDLDLSGRRTAVHSNPGNRAFNNAPRIKSSHPADFKSAQSFFLK